MFLRFANFYRWFIQGFSRIVAPLTLILKISRSTKSLIWPGKGGVGVSGDNKTAHDESKLDGSEIDNDEVDEGKIEDKVGKKDQNLSKSKN